MSTIANLLVKIGADASEFKKAIGQTKKELKEWSTALTAVGKLTAPLAGALLGIGAAGLKAGKDLDDAFDTIRVGTGATGKDLDGLKDDFRSVFANVASDSKTVSAALAGLHTKTGATGDVLRNLATQQVNLARITKAEVGPNIDATSKAFNSWAVSTGNQSRALDFLFKTSQATGPSVAMLSGIITEAGPALRQMGFGFEEAAVLAGKLQKETGDAAGVLGSLQKALKELAERGITDSHRALETLIVRIKAARTETEGNALAVQFFGRSGIRMAAAIREGRFSIEDLLKVIKGLPKTINETADATDDFTEKWEKLKHRAELALDPLGKAMFDALGRVVDRLAPAADEAKRLTESFGRLSNTTKDVIFTASGLAIGLSSGTLALGWLAKSAMTSLDGLRALQKHVPLVGAALSVLSPVVSGLAGAFVGWRLAQWAEREFPVFTAHAKQFGEGLKASHPAIRAVADAMQYLRDALEGGGKSASGFGSRFHKALLDAEVKRASADLADVVKNAGAAGGALVGLGKQAERGLGQVTEATRILNDFIDKNFRETFERGLLDPIASGPIMAQRLAVALGQTTFEMAQMSLGANRSASQVRLLADSEAELKFQLDTVGVAARETARQEQMLRNVDEELSKEGKVKWQIPEKVKAAKKPLQEVSTALSNMSQRIGDLVVDWKGFGSVFTGIAKQIGSAIISSIIQNLILTEDRIKAITGAIGGVLKHIPGLGKLGSGAGAIVDGGSDFGAATRGLGGGGGAGSAAAGGIMGTIGAAGSVASAISGVIGNFQMHGMNKTLDLIEKATRYSQAYLLETLGLQQRYVPWIRSIADVLWGPHLEYLGMINDAIRTELPSALGGRAAMAGAYTVNVTGNNFYGVTTPAMVDELTERIVERLKLRGV